MRFALTDEGTPGPLESGGTGPARIAHVLLDEERTCTRRIVAPGPVHLDGTTIVRQGKLGQLPVGRYRLNTSTASEKVPAWDS